MDWIGLQFVENGLEMMVPLEMRSGYFDLLKQQKNKSGWIYFSSHDFIN
jgi:hypothetical protein